MNPKLKIKKDIKEKRESLGLNARQFAELFNRTYPTSIKTTKTDIYRWEHGITNPPALKYVKIMALGLDDAADFLI